MFEPIQVCLPMTQSLWNVYLVECGDGSLYCGIATNIERRLAEHASGKGARYTRGRGPLRLVWFSVEPMTRSEASKLEIKIKKMTRKQKEAFIRRGIS